MAIPAMITAMGEQQANYGAAVGQSLAQLGQQVGQQLAMQEYQKQAAAQLPFISEQMQLATREASEGKFGDAYSKIIGLTANPSVTQNPFILPALEMGMQAIKQGSSQAWFNLQNRQQGGGGGVGGETEVVYETPTSEQMADPNYRPVAKVVPKVTRTAAPTTPTSGGTPREQALEIDRQTPLPGMEANFTDTVAEMDMGEQGAGGGGGFEFGWSYEEGYRPTADRRKSFERQYNNFLNAPAEEQEKIKEQAQIPQEEVPEGKQVIPFRMALNPNIVGIVGPKSSVEVEKITQVFKDGSQEDRRDLIKKDPLAATINDLQRADSIISGNNTLRNLHKQIEGNYSKVTTERELRTDDPKTDTFRIFIDGTEVPDAKTDANGAEAIGIMQAKEVAALTGKYGFVTGQPTEAPAAGVPQERFPVKQQQAEATAAQQKATQPRQLTLEEEIAQATTAAKTTPTRTATKEQIAGVERSRVAQSRSTLESEKRRLESSIYQVSRGTGQKSLKRGITKQLEDRVKERIAQIDKELEGLK